MHTELFYEKRNKVYQYECHTPVVKLNDIYNLQSFN